MRSQLERAINLSSRTGDKIIVVDEFNDRSSVVMSLDDYEMLLKGRNKGGNSARNLTEEELLDKINHDIISWKDANSDRNFSSEIPSLHDSWPAYAKATADKGGYNFDDNDDEDELDFDEDVDDEESDFAKTSPFAEATGDKSADKDESDWTPPHFDADGNIIPDLKDDELDDEPFFAKATEDEAELVPEETTPEEPVIEKVAESVAAESKVDEDENVYYYHEPGLDKPETEKDESGFTSIKDALKKNRQAWAIPSDVKEKAEDVKI
jgi:hypothetical protein